MRWLLVAVLLGSAVPVHAQDYPPAYPRAGAEAMLENDDVIVWNISWLRQAYPVHRHRYDHVGVYYAPGDRVITSTEGEERPVSTPAWNISFQLRDVTHAEAGTSEEPLRAVFIQMKREPREGPAAASGAPLFPTDGPTERLDNDRVHVWEYAPDWEGTAREHRHAHDAVVVSFDASNEPRARWVPRGTVHETDAPSGASRTLVFEIR